MSWKDKWEKNIFSDEKKFNFDGLSDYRTLQAQHYVWTKQKE